MNVAVNSNVHTDPSLAGASRKAIFRIIDRKSVSRPNLRHWTHRAASCGGGIAVILSSRSPEPTRRRDIHHPSTPSYSRVAQHDICGSDATPAACRPRNRIKGIGHIRPHHPTTLHPLFRAAGHQSRHGDVISKSKNTSRWQARQREVFFDIFVMCPTPALVAACSKERLFHRRMV